MPSRVKTSTDASWIVKVRESSVTGMPTTVKVRAEPLGFSRNPSPSRSRYPLASSICKLFVSSALDLGNALIVTWYVGTLGLYQGTSSWMTGLREMIVDGYSWRYRIGFSVSASASRKALFAVGLPDAMLNPNDSCVNPGFWTTVALLRSDLFVPPMLMIADGSSTRRFQPMKSRFPVNRSVAAAVVLPYTLNVTLCKYGGRKCAAFAVRVHDVAVEDDRAKGPLPTGLLAVPDFTIGRVSPCPKRIPPLEAEVRVTVLPELDTTVSTGTRPAVLYWVYEYTTSVAVTVEPSWNQRSDRNVTVSVLPETDHDSAAHGVGVSVAGSIRARPS